jgi:prepilin-type N-terminal cleavage/methylation domain-containing protein
MKRKSLTLIELIMVIAIIALLASVIYPHADKFFRQSRDAKRLADMRVLEAGIEAFYDDHGRYPGFVDGVGQDNDTGECVGDVGNPDGVGRCLGQAGFEALMRQYLRAGVPGDPLYSGQPDQYYYAYDNMHEVDWCDGIAGNDLLGADEVPVLGFRRSETEVVQSANQRDTCRGGEFGLNSSVYNVAFTPP